MSNAANILNNTILIPYHDSLVSSHQLPAIDVAKKIEAIDIDKIDNESFSYAAYLKLNDGGSERLIAVQEITGFGMSRDNEQKPGTARDYVINLPGPVNYSDVKISHLHTKDQFFLKWMMNGVSQGGAARADMELFFTLPTRKKIIFTLYDAFPVKWELKNVDVSSKEVLIEQVTLTYSTLSYKTEES